MLFMLKYYIKYKIYFVPVMLYTVVVIKLLKNYLKKKQYVDKLKNVFVLT